MNRWNFKDRFMLFQIRPGSTWDISGPCPQITACATPSEKCALQARIMPRNKVTGLVPLARILGTVPPPKYCLCPPSMSKVSFQDKKLECTPRVSIRFCAKDLFLVSTIEFVGKERDPHHWIPPRPVRQYKRAPPPTKTCAPYKRKRPG